MATKAAGSYEGGIGGKFRRRTLRKTPATPYDRPPTGPHALRNPSRNGWLSKLVDPASKIFTGSATRLFSSVFRKRLPAPPTISEADPDPVDEPPEPFSINPSSGALEQGGNEGDNHVNSSNSNGINELEQLLKQKTFTRTEFDRLTELLRSRTVDLSADVEKKRTDPTTSEPAITQVGQEKETTTTPENGLRSSRLFASTSTAPVAINIPDEEVASPAELAKAYMGTRLPKLSPSTLGFRVPAFREEIVGRETNMLSVVPFTPKSPNISFASRSAVNFSGAPGLPENGLLTSRLRGRSAIYTSVRTPYSRVSSTAALKGAEPADDGYTAPSTSSQWRHASSPLSSGKQVSKRRSSVFDNGFGSVGPIRRIRQKSNLMSTSKDISVRGSALSIPLTPMHSGSVQGSTSSNKKPLLLDEHKYDSLDQLAAEERGVKISSAIFASVPPKSSETATKILQHLDRLVSPTKEKSSELKRAMAREKSPSKLTHGMLNGRALKSMDQIESPKFQYPETKVTLGDQSSCQAPSLGNWISQKDRFEENGPVKTADVAVTLASEGDSVENVVASVKDTISGMKTADSVTFSFAANPPRNKRGFQMSAPEDVLELDDDNSSSKADSAVEKEKLQLPVLESRTGGVEALIAEKPKPPVSSLENKPAASFKMNREPDMTTRGDGPILTKKNASFAFPITPVPSNVSVPTMLPSSLLDKSTQPKEQTEAPIFSFGSKSAKKGPAFTFSPGSNTLTNTSGLKFGATLDSMSSKATAAATSPATPQEASWSEKGDKSPKAIENAVASGISTSTNPKFFGFGPTNSSLSNGSLISTSSTFSISAAPAAPVSGNLGGMISCSSAATSISSSSPSVSAVAPTFSTTSVFRVGSAASAALLSSTSVSAPSATSGLKLTDSEPKTKQASLFSTAGSSPPAASSSTFTNMGSSSFGFSASVPSNTTSSSSSALAQNTNSFDSNSGSLFGTQAASSGSGGASFMQSAVSQFGSSASSWTFGLSGSSSFGSGVSAFGSSTPGAKPFGSDSGFGLSTTVSFSAGAGASTSAATSTGLFSSSSQPASTSAIISTSLFGSSSLPAPSSIFGSGFGTTASSGTGFSFGASAGMAGSAPFSFGSSSGSMFSFTSASAATSSSSLSSVQPIFGMSNPVGFGSGSPGNDQMNVEDSMAEDTVQTSMPVGPAFGQTANSPSLLNFSFGSPAAPSGPSVFQFGGQQNLANPQNPSPFTPTNNLELTGGGSFSIGTSGTEKANRRYVKVRRDKARKK